MKKQRVKKQFANVAVQSEGAVSYYDGERWIKAMGNFPLLLIDMAWHAGLDLEAEADGYGEGYGTMGGDWSGIRDSSEAAQNKMLEKSLNFIAERLRKK